MCRPASADNYAARALASPGRTRLVILHRTYNLPPLTSSGVEGHVLKDLCGLETILHVGSRLPADQPSG